MRLLIGTMKGKITRKIRRGEQRPPSVTTFSKAGSGLDRRVQAGRESFPEKKSWPRKLAVQTLSSFQNPVCREAREPG